jgi:hypothetical protein
MKVLSERQAWKDYHERKGVPRPPLRNLKELSEEFGVHIGTISGKLKKEGSPKPVFNREKGHWCKNASYYNHKEFQEWWEKVKDDSSTTKTGTKGTK